MNNRDALVSRDENKSVFIYTQGERVGKIQGSAEFAQYPSVEKAQADGVDVLTLVNAKLRAVAVNAAAGIANSDGVETLKSLNAEIRDAALRMASGSLSTTDGQVKMADLIARLNKRKASK